MKHRKIVLPLGGYQQFGLWSVFVVSIILIIINRGVVLGWMTLTTGGSNAVSSTNTISLPAISTVIETIITPAVETGIIMVDSGQIHQLVSQTTSLDELHHDIRQLIVAQVLAYGFTGRQAHPYAGDTDGMMYSIGTGEFALRYAVESRDELDIYLDDVLEQYRSLPLDPALRDDIDTKDITIKSRKRRDRSDINLFTQTSDLKALGYEIVSHRTRVNRDKEYRRYNIMTAFAKMGNVLVLNPGQTVSYLNDIDYDEGPKLNYKYGLSIIGDEEIMDYGGGICGSSTAIYQGILTNTALDITKQRNHTRRYSNLYPAVINGEMVTTPGLDSALYGPILDLHFTNTRNYPVIIVANYDGSVGGTEEIFSLGRAQDRGSFEFVSSRKTTTTDADGKTLHGGCYVWTVNGEQRKSCYKKVE